MVEQELKRKMGFNFEDDKSDDDWRDKIKSALQVLPYFFQKFL